MMMPAMRRYFEKEENSAAAACLKSERLDAGARRRRTSRNKVAGRQRPILCEGIHGGCARQSWASTALLVLVDSRQSRGPQARLARLCQGCTGGCADSER